VIVALRETPDKAACVSTVSRASSGRSEVKPSRSPRRPACSISNANVPRRQAPKVKALPLSACASWQAADAVAVGDRGFDPMSTPLRLGSEQVHELQDRRPAPNHRPVGKAPRDQAATCPRASRATEPPRLRRAFLLSCSCAYADQPPGSAAPGSRAAPQTETASERAANPVRGERARGRHGCACVAEPGRGPCIENRHRGVPPSWSQSWRMTPCSRIAPEAASRRSPFTPVKAHEWVDVTTDDIFKGKTVVVFSLPGAFTPTCSSSHVPRYNQLAPTFKEHGVDEVVCMSVNDTFVMNEWKKSQHAENVTFIPDGNGEFTDGMGMLVGQGRPRLRQALLALLDAGARRRRRADVHRARGRRRPLRRLGCRHHAGLSGTGGRQAARRDRHDPRRLPLLRQGERGPAKAGIAFEELVLNRDYTEQTLRAVANAASVPQVFVNGKLIGGSESVEAWLKERQRRLTSARSHERAIRPRPDRPVRDRPAH
jgi:peroxiredoxin/glutaredoxin